MPAFVPPADYSRIKVVHSFEELVTTRFDEEVNALCWTRELEGNFQEVVEAIGDGDEITTVDEALLASLSLSAAGQKAVRVLLEDQRLLRERDLAPILNCIHGYRRDDEPGPVRTDVFSFHADSATTEADTWLCTYHGPASEGLRNDQAIRKVDIPETRAALLELFGGEEGEEFHEFLNDHFYDLHYAPLPQAQPFPFGVGNLWRIAVELRKSPVLPCIHRAPDTVPGQSPRLLLIS